METIPNNTMWSDFTRRITGAYGTAGGPWLTRFPELLAEAARRWELTIEPPYQLSYNYVTPARRRDGTRVVLKLGPPNIELTTEIAALRHYNGNGAVRLLDADAEAGFLLLEQITPGTPLIEIKDDETATGIAIEVIRRIQQPPLPPGHPFPSITRWTDGLKKLRERFDGGTGPLPAPMVEEAEQLFDELVASMASPVLIHGDLHHLNILSDRQGNWVAIDPKGLAGEPAYEVGAWMRNPLDILEWPDLERTMARRIDQFAAGLNLDRARVAGWSFAQAILSAWWSVEEGNQHDWEYAVACAAAIKKASHNK